MLGIVTSSLFVISPGGYGVAPLSAACRVALRERANRAQAQSTG